LEARVVESETPLAVGAHLTIERETWIVFKAEQASDPDLFDQRLVCRRAAE
jgi:hypothetical protein